MSDELLPPSVDADGPGTADEDQEPDAVPRPGAADIAKVKKILAGVIRGLADEASNDSHHTLGGTPAPAPLAPDLPADTSPETGSPAPPADRRLGEEAARIHAFFADAVRRPPSLASWVPGEWTGQPRVPPRLAMGRHAWDKDHELARQAKVLGHDIEVIHYCGRDRIGESAVELRREQAGPLLVARLWSEGQRLLDDFEYGWVIDYEESAMLVFDCNTDLRVKFRLDGAGRVTDELEKQTEVKSPADEPKLLMEGYQQLRHPSRVAGGDVIGAGTLRLKDGLIRTLTDKSGHYRPALGNTASAVQWFADHGYLHSQVDVVLAGKSDDPQGRPVGKKPVLEDALAHDQVCDDDFPMAREEIAAVWAAGAVETIARRHRAVTREFKAAVADVTADAAPRTASASPDRPRPPVAAPSPLDVVGGAKARINIRRFLRNASRKSAADEADRALHEQDTRRLAEAGRSRELAYQQAMGPDWDATRKQALAYSLAAVKAVGEGLSDTQLAEVAKIWRARRQQAPPGTADAEVAQQALQEWRAGHRQ